MLAVTGNPPGISCKHIQGPCRLDWGTPAGCRRVAARIPRPPGSFPQDRRTDLRHSRSSADGTQAAAAAARIPRPPGSFPQDTRTDRRHSGPAAACTPGAAARIPGHAAPSPADRCIDRHRIQDQRRRAHRRLPRIACPAARPADRALTGYRASTNAGGRRRRVFPPPRSLTRIVPAGHTHSPVALRTNGGGQMCDFATVTQSVLSGGLASTTPEADVNPTVAQFL